MTAVGDVIRVDVEGDHNGVDQLINSWHVRIGANAPSSVSNLLRDLQELFEALYNTLDALWAATTIWRRIRAFNVTTQLALGIEPFAAPIPGSATSQSSALAVAALASGRLENSNTQIRKYFGPLVEGAVDVDALIGPSTESYIITGLATILGTITINTSDYEIGYPLQGIAADFRPVESWFTSPVPAYQRRRKQGRGS